MAEFHVGTTFGAQLACVGPQVESSLQTIENDNRLFKNIIIKFQQQLKNVIFHQKYTNASYILA